VRSTLDFIASLLWLVAWSVFVAILFIVSAVVLPFVLAAFFCGRLSKYR
jgi:predicted PurR-regulated permease PerM